MIDSKMHAKKEIAVLIEKYEKISENNKLKRYKDFTEEETKKDFILPLFRALGWNVEDSNEVSAEETISKKRVDYGFRLNQIPKFFVEVKALKIDLDKPEYAEQAIGYSWHKGCTWAILTDFEAIKIFNAEIIFESRLQSLFTEIKYTEFLDRFDELWMLSKQGIKEELLNKKAEKYSKKSKKIRIDEQLIDDFTRFRNILSININILNKSKKLSEEDIDESVQRVLDRLIFIRNCEDRELEDKKLLAGLRDNQNKQNIISINVLREIFNYYKKEYGSKIFEEHLCDTLNIDSNILSKIIYGLYRKEDDSYYYDFSALDSDILGNIYEQYLGHILKKTKKRIRLDEKITKRKESGIYYTPTNIVEYMVKNTLEEILIEKKSIEKIRIIDPACGSGSFLIKVFDILDEYWKNEDDKYAQTKFDLQSGDVFTKKVNILKNNIFGVDLDNQAIEIAKLNLLLKILEKGQKLPLLRENIKCGNSLIEDSEIYRNKSFVWNKEFEKIMDEGGFDIVIGNPPYVNAMELSQTYDKKVKKYWKDKYSSARGAYDLYILFFEQALNICKKDGLVCLITPNKYISSPYGEAFRELVSREYKLIKIVDLSKNKIFGDVSVYPVITIIKKTKPEEEYDINIERIYFQDMKDNESFKISSRDITSLPNTNWGMILSENSDIIRKIFKKSKPLEKVADVQATSTASESGEYVEYISEKKSGIKIINTGTIDRYRTTWGMKNCSLGKGMKLLEPFLDITKVSENRKALYNKPKIIFAKLALRIEAFPDIRGKYSSINTNCVHSPNKNFSLIYLSGILNSNVMSFIYSEIFSGQTMSKGYFQFQAPQLRQLPIVESSKNKQKEISEMVNHLLSLEKRLEKIGDKKTNKRDEINREIKKTDDAINNLVYNIYGLTKKEIEIIEEKMK